MYLCVSSNYLRMLCTVVYSLYVSLPGFLFTCSFGREISRASVLHICLNLFPGIFNVRCIPHVYLPVFIIRAMLPFKLLPSYTECNYLPVAAQICRCTVRALIFTPVSLDCIYGFLLSRISLLPDLPFTCVSLPFNVYISTCRYLVLCKG